ncbi:MAG: hypothetical protein WD048_11380 [Chitinophagales bacterium]
MRMLKPFISALLVLTYSIGFAHNLIPHCHELHKETHSKDHNSVNHVDEESEKRFLDLIFLFFSELEHSSDIIKFERNKNTDKSFLSDLAKVKTLAIVAAFFHLVEVEQETPTTHSEQLLVYHASFQENAPSRGSPILSC